jgi:multiple sugar transport system permease protein
MSLAATFPRQVDSDRRRVLALVAIYAALIVWAFISLFPVYWTITTSFKSAVDVQRSHLIPWVDFVPNWKGWRSLGLSPDTIFETSTVRDEFLKRFTNSIITAFVCSVVGVVLL